MLRFRTDAEITIHLQPYGWFHLVAKGDRIGIEAELTYLDYDENPIGSHLGKRCITFTSRDNANVKIFKNGELILETKGIGQ